MSFKRFTYSRPVAPDYVEQRPITALLMFLDKWTSWQKSIRVCAACWSHHLAFRKDSYTDLRWS